MPDYFRNLLLAHPSCHIIQFILILSCVALGHCALRLVGRKKKVGMVSSLLLTIFEPPPPPYQVIQLIHILSCVALGHCAFSLGGREK